MTTDGFSRDRDLVHGDIGSLGLGKPEDLATTTQPISPAGKS